jgi:hypothetical protein
MRLLNPKSKSLVAGALLLIPIVKSTFLPVQSHVVHFTLSIWFCALQSLRIAFGMPSKEWNLQRFQHIFFAEAEALAVGNIAHVSAKLAIGPQKLSDGGEQVLDVIVPLDQRGNVAGRARRGNIFERLRGLRTKAQAWPIQRLATTNSLLG